MVPVAYKYDCKKEDANREDFDPIETTGRLFVAAHGDAIGLKCGDKEKINHWAIYVPVADGDSDIKSVRFDMKPSNEIGRLSTDCLMGELNVSALTSILSDSVVKIFEIKIPADVSIGQIITMICNNKYHCYDFHSSGIGCRYWIKSTLALLSGAGLVDGNDVLQACEGMKHAWIKGQNEPVLCLAFASGAFHFGK